MFKNRGHFFCISGDYFLTLTLAMSYFIVLSGVVDKMLLMIVKVEPIAWNYFLFRSKEALKWSR